MEIYVTRHGQTIANQKQCMCGRRRGYSLTEQGIEQAKKAGILVDELNYDMVICSPLERTKITCDIVNTKNKIVLEDKRIMERDCGIMEGQPKDKFDYAHYWNYNYELDVEGMEPIKKFAQTVWEFLDEIKQRYPDGKILIVTHNGVCRMIGAYCNGIPEDGDLNLYAHDNCEIKSYVI